MTKDELLAQITGLLGGRVSEEMFLNEISTGASDDFKKQHVLQEVWLLNME